MATVKDTFAASTSLTVTLAALASSTSGVGRQTTLVDNTSNLYTSALVSVSITVGITPTANTPINVYLIRYDNSAVADDGAGTSDAGLTVKSAPSLGTLNCAAATTNAVYSGLFDTSSLGTLGPKWGIAIVNGTGVALAAAGSSVTFIGVYKTVA